MRDPSQSAAGTVPRVVVVGGRPTCAEGQDQRPAADLRSPVAPGSDSRAAPSGLEPEGYGWRGRYVSTRSASNRLALLGAWARSGANGRTASEAIEEARCQAAGGRRCVGLWPAAGGTLALDGRA